MNVTFVQQRHQSGIFMLRAAGVARRGDDVLLHRAEDDGFWSLPGGRVGFGEPAEEALRREMMEEVGADVVVGPAVAVVENFFDSVPIDRTLDLADAVITHHEIGLYFHLEMPVRYHERDEFPGVELAGTSQEFCLLFRWVSGTALPDLDVRPAVLRPLLAQPFVPVVRHLVEGR